GLSSRSSSTRARGCASIAPMAPLAALTWNVWFGGHRFDERCAALLDEIGRADADLIALQEVTPELFAYLVAAPWPDGYALSDPTGDTLGDYGAVILSRLPMAQVELCPLPTEMGRSLVVVDIDAPGVAGAAALTFATVHLESLGES